MPIDILKNTSFQAVSEQRSAIKRMIHDGISLHIIVTPAQIDHKNYTLGLILELANEKEVTPFLLILQLIAGYLFFYGFHDKLLQNENLAINASAFIEIMTEATHEQNTETALRLILNRLQNHLGCEKVAIVLKKHTTYRLCAISGMKDFDKRGNLAKTFERAAQETMRKQEIIHYSKESPETREIQFHRCHNELLELTDTQEIMTQILSDMLGKEIGTWIFLWKKDKRSTPENIHFIKAGVLHITELIQLLKIARPYAFLKRSEKFSRKIQMGILSFSFIGAFFSGKASL